MNRDSNAYTFIFSIVMVIVVAGALAFTASSLKEKQQINVKNEKMQNILSTIDIHVTREEAKDNFDKYIIKQLSLDDNAEVDKSVNAFDIDLSKELKKPVDQQRFPLYVAESDNSRYYIIPLRGSGLWNAIWGYISIKEDLNTVKAAIFDHLGETAGLGGEITEEWFQKSFRGETLFEGNKFVGITVAKGNNDPKGTDKTDHEVDAISGATITGNGVTEMIKERLSHYVDYFDKIK